MVITIKTAPYYKCKYLRGIYAAKMCQSHRWSGRLLFRVTIVVVVVVVHVRTPNAAQELVYATTLYMYDNNNCKKKEKKVTFVSVGRYVRHRVV